MSERDFDDACDEACQSLEEYTKQALVQSEANLLLLVKLHNPLDMHRQSAITRYGGHVHALDQFTKTLRWPELNCCDILSKRLAEKYLCRRQLSNKYRASNRGGDVFNKSNLLLKDRGYKEVVQRLRAFVKATIDRMVKVPKYLHDPSCGYKSKRV